MLNEFTSAMQVIVHEQQTVNSAGRQACISGAF